MARTIARLALVAWVAALRADAAAQAIDGMQSVSQGTQLGSVVVTADGRHVYAVGGAIHEPAFFARDPATGALSSIGFGAFVGGDDVVATPDGAHVYFAQGDQILGFARDAGTGALGALAPVALDAGAGPCALSASADGAFVLAACRGADAVLSFARTAGTGALAAPVSVAAAGDPVDLVVSPSGDSVYVACSADDAIRAYSRDGATGALTPIAGVVNGENGVTGLDQVAGLAITPDGGGVYAIGRVTALRGSVVAFARDAASGLLSFVQQTGPTNVPTTRIAASDAVVWVLSHVNEGGAGGSQRQELYAFGRDANSDALAFGDFVVSSRAHPLGAGGLALDPSGAEIVATGGFVGLNAARASENTGFLALEQSLADGEGGVSGLAGGRAVAVSANGERVFVLTNTPDGLTSFVRDEQTGLLAFADANGTGFGDPFAIASSPSGDFVYVADDDLGLVIHGVAAPSGALTHLGATTEGLGAGGARSLALSRDGAHLYASGSESGGIAHYARDAASGALTHLDTAVAAPFGATSLALSSDERFLDVVYNGDLIALPRDLATGTLGAASTPDLPGILLSAVAPRAGQHLYAMTAFCDPCSQELLVYPRDALTGAPGAFVQSISSPVVGSPLGPPRVFAAPDGRVVYLVGPNHVAAFERDRATGAIALADVETGPAAGATTSPGGEHVYVVSASGELRVYAPAPSALASGIAALCAITTAKRRRRAVA